MSVKRRNVEFRVSASTNTVQLNSEEPGRRKTLDVMLEDHVFKTRLVWLMLGRAYKRDDMIVINRHDEITLLIFYNIFTVYH